MTGLIAWIKRRKAKQAKKAHGHHHGGQHSHGGHSAHHHGRKAGKASGAKKVPHPKPRTVAA